MTALAYVCRAQYSGPYECGAAEYYVGKAAMIALGLIGAVSLVVTVWSWWTGRRR